MTAPDPRIEPGARILAEVAAERGRQHAKWGEQNHPNGTGDDVTYRTAVSALGPFPGAPPTMGTMAYVSKRHTDTMATAGRVTFADILLEEVFEALAEADSSRLRTELIQVAAVAAQWVEAIDRATVLQEGTS
jgi:hypothetical protein